MKLSMTLTNGVATMNTDKQATGILINPQDRTITEVQWNGDRTHISELIGAKYFDVCRVDGNNMCFVDDEGLINGAAGTIGMIAWVGSHGTAFLAGKILLLGTRGEHTVSTNWTVDKVREAIDWGYPIRAAGKIYFNGEKKLHSMEGY